jgi:hypothetical protein
MLRAEAGAAAPGQGVVDVDGQRWVAYTGERGEPIWITIQPVALSQLHGLRLRR